MQRFRFSPRHPIVRVAFTPDGTGIVTARPHTSVDICDRATGVARTTFATHNAAGFSELLVHPTHDLLAVRTPKWCRVYETTGNTRPDSFDAPREFAGVSITGDGFRVYDASFPDAIIAIDCGGQTGTRRLRVRTAADPIGVSPDGRLALAVRQRVRPVLIDLDTGRVVAELQSALRSHHVKPGHAVFAFPANGTKLAIGTGDSLAVFDLTQVHGEDGSVEERDDETNRKKKVLYPLFTIDRPDPVAGRGTYADRTAERWLPPLAFDPDGETLLTVGLRNRVQRIDVASGVVQVEWGWRADTVRSLAVAPDRMTAAAGCRMGELIVWDLE